MPYLVFAFIIALVTAAFAFQNPGAVTLKFFKWQFQGSLAFVALSIFALGFIVNFFLSLASMMRHRWALYNQKKRIKELEDELADRDKRPVYDNGGHSH